jgi:hypothetical protein
LIFFSFQKAGTLEHASSIELGNFGCVFPLRQPFAFHLSLFSLTFRDMNTSIVAIEEKILYLK